MCSVAYWTGGQHVIEAAFSGDSDFGPSASGLYGNTVRLALPGYWLATRGGSVYGAGAAPSLGGMVTSAATGPVVGIAGTPTGKGYWVVTSNGMVAAFGDAAAHGDLPRLGVTGGGHRGPGARPTTAAATGWSAGTAGFLLSVTPPTTALSPASRMKKRVDDIVGMVAGPGGAGYLLVGADGGVFAFGSARFYGSLPGIKAHVMTSGPYCPSSAGTGYVLVGRDGGAFVFGKGVDYHGSLPGRGGHGQRHRRHRPLTPDNGGYFMAASDGSVFGFGDAKPFAVPTGPDGPPPGGGDRRHLREPGRSMSVLYSVRTMSSSPCAGPPRRPPWPSPVPLPPVWPRPNRPRRQPRHQPNVCPSPTCLRLNRPGRPWRRRSPTRAPRPSRRGRLRPGPARGAAGHASSWPVPTPTTRP